MLRPVHCQCRAWLNTCGNHNGPSNSVPTHFTERAKQPIFGFGALQRSLHGSRPSEMDPNSTPKSPCGQRSMSRVLDPSQGGSKAKYWQFLGHILAFPDPPANPVKFLGSKSGFYSCLTYSTTCFSSITSLRCNIQGDFLTGNWRYWVENSR